MGETRGAVVPAQDDDRVLQFADGLQLFQELSQHRIQRLGFAQVVGQVFADFRNVRQEPGDLALQRFRLDSPQRLA